MKRILMGLLFAMPLLAQAQTASPGLAEVRALGLLNGEALACKQMAMVDRIRISVVYEAAKTREVGEVFEAATSERFLAMGSDKSTCPTSRDLSARVEAAIQAMRAAFGQAAK